jgi:hypothetical protein
LKGFLRNRAAGPGSAAFIQAAESPPPYRFGEAEDCQVWAAVSAVQRARAWALVYGVYLAKGYAQLDAGRLWYGLHDALPETATFLAERAGQAVAALTVVPDSPCALPADAAWGRELAGLRGPGRRLCEIANLASVDSEQRRGGETLYQLFKLAWLVARRLSDATDLIVRVSPQHRLLYERRLLFRPLAPERPDGGPGGSPGVLLALDLEAAEGRFREKYGDGPHSLYRFFVDPETEPEFVEWLKLCRRPLTEITLRRFFVETRPLLPGAAPAARAHLAGRYPGVDLEPGGPAAPPG